MGRHQNIQDMTVKQITKIVINRRYLILSTTHLWGNWLNVTPRLMITEKLAIVITNTSAETLLRWRLEGKLQGYARRLTNPLDDVERKNLLCFMLDDIIRLTNSIHNLSELKTLLKPTFDKETEITYEDYDKHRSERLQAYKNRVAKKKRFESV